MQEAVRYMTPHAEARFDFQRFAAAALFLEVTTDAGATAGARCREDTPTAGDASHRDRRLFVSEVRICNG